MSIGDSVRGSVLGPQSGSLLSRVTARESPLRRLDWVLVAAVLALSVVSALLVWSATRPKLIDAGDDPQSFLKKHVLLLAIGLVLGSLVAALDYRMLRAYAPIVYIVACGGLVAVLTPLGATVNGSHSWIIIGGGFQVQPSEFAKVALVVIIAMVLGEPRDGEAVPRNGDVWLTLGLAAVPMALIMLQPDLGTMLVFCAVILGMLMVAGSRRRWLFGLLAGGIILALAVWKLGILHEYQIKRFTAFADPSADPRGSGYNARQALVAVGSGGLFGAGLFHGEQTNGHFVPEQQTDFIFTVAGEELGFVGSAAIIVLLGVILWRGLRIARQCEEMYGRLLATGIVCWLAFQTFINIGMCLGITPITGLPLPFVSYGGSSTFADLIAIGLLQGVHLRRDARFD
ncbi:MAG TPA: rod shape-determining protein RodA [Streptosporangiaceae bacterium]|jgi:rod shape determining protein RodA